jgi:murein DD-endopeptidase MepM/ murein hydrolase activator NlpD
MVHLRRGSLIAIFCAIAWLLVMNAASGLALASDPLLYPTAPADAASVAALATAVIDAITTPEQTAAADLAQLRSLVASLEAQDASLRAQLASIDPASAGRDQQIGRLQRQVIDLSAQAGPLSIPEGSDLSEAAALRAERESLTGQDTTFSALTRTLSSLAAQLQRDVDALDRARGSARSLLAGPIVSPAAALVTLEAVTRDAQAARSALAADTGANVGEPLAPLRPWAWPSSGPVTQGFGPTTIDVEPSRVYAGATFIHFHDAIDIGAPLSSPVVAAVAGTVTFVGHFTDGAMVVQIADADGLVETYAHLDDRALPPPVHAGDAVAAGQRIGSIGLTGITTGAHLHFAVYRGDVPVDALLLLPPR